MYLLRMSDASVMTGHLNLFINMLIKLLFVDIKISDEEKCISLLYSFPDSWDSLVMAIGINTTTLALEEVVVSLLLKAMRRKNMEGSTKYSFVVRGRLVDKYKGIFSSRMFNLNGISRSLVQLTQKL
jgi:hypothetical protein